MIHSGTWGFASSPIVTEDEIRRITKIAAEVARASAIAKKTDVRLAPVPAFQAYWATPLVKNPDSVPRETKQEFVQKVVDTVVKNKGVQNVNVSVNLSYEWKYFASSEGSYIEQESCFTNPSFSVTARKDDVVRTRTFSAVPKGGGWEVAEDAKMLENAERIAEEAVEFTTAKPVDMGVKDLILTPSHAMLTIHEIVAHATELDRIMGYEANYAGTSFVKISDLEQAEVRIEDVQRHRRQDHPGRPRHGRVRRRRREDDEVPDRARRHPRRPDDQPRDRALHQREREPRLHLRELVARLSVPAHGQRPRRAGPAGIADAGADHRRHQGRRADRRPRQLLDRPAALQRPVRRQRLLGDQERQEDAAW